MEETLSISQNYDGRLGVDHLGPQYRYEDTAQYHGKDVFGREVRGTYDDRSIDTINGKFVPLKVQCADDVLSGTGGSTWARCPIKGVGPLTLRLADWPFKDLQDDKEPLDILASSFDTPMASLSMLGKCLALVPPMIFLGTFFRPSSGQIRNGGRYDPVPYRYWGRAKKNRNLKEDKNLYQYDSGFTGRLDASDSQRHFPAAQRDDFGGTDQGAHMRRSANERLERVLLPRKLCFMDQSPTQEVDSETGETFLEYQSTDVQQWMKENRQSCPEYLFVAWITNHFPDDDREKLHELARHATREAGLPCYWVSDNCLTEPDESGPKRTLDVWRISDVIRGARELAVILRPPKSGELVESLLKEWAKSLWTLPELLLSPGSHFTGYYHSSTEPSSKTVKEVIPKNQFSARYLLTDDDRYQVRRLLDHYLGSLKLSDLELMTVALHCFSSRTTRGRLLSGDYSYALMGLLGRRPSISPTDSAFLTFARLSLENYNSRLFERFICTLPAARGQPWHNIKDAYGAQLWDIEPSVQVAGIGEYNADKPDPVDDAMFEREYFLASANEENFAQDDSGYQASAPLVYYKLSPHSELEDDDVVILDGCRAATVHWDQFQRVWHAKRLSTKRRVLQWMLRINIIPFLVGLVLAIVGSQSQSQSPSTYYVGDGLTPRNNAAINGFAALFLIYSLGIYFAAPFIIRVVYGGKFWETQPWFFGFEGHLPIGDIEAKIFGTRKGRLAWSHYASSPLSQHVVKHNRWVVPQDPCDDTNTAELARNARNAKPGHMRVFTIVDTYSMTATLFEAVRPPQALLVCGSEGGMQRALACSFEWTTSTFYKETVLRIETRVLGRMDRIRRVRLGIKRKPKPTKACRG